MNSNNIEDLTKAWYQLASWYCKDVNLIDSMFNDIAKRYVEPHRHYHTLEHLRSVLSDLAEPIKILDSAIENGVLFSTWYHDIIYKPGDRENEAQSAKYAVEQLKALGVSENIIAFVEHAILCTQKHQDPHQDLGTQFFLDADMAILGKSREEYLAYTDKVRQEFKHIPIDLYRRGRNNFLQSTLDRPRIYFSDYFYALYEKQARQNMRSELID